MEPCKETAMQQQYIVALVVVGVLVVLALVVWAAMRKRKSAALASKFGPEYERAVAEAGKRSKAEAELEARAKRRETLRIHALTPADRERYLDLWRSTQARFVDSPAAAVGEADHLVTEVMRLR